MIIYKYMYTYVYGYVLYQIVYHVCISNIYIVCHIIVRGVNSRLTTGGAQTATGFSGRFQQPHCRISCAGVPRSQTNTNSN